MANRELREKAVKLRLEGYTYGQIKRELNLSKSTLSDWLKNLPLSPEVLINIERNKATSKDIGREKFRQTFRNRWISRLEKVLEIQKQKILPLSDKELFLAGVFLYWGEGGKRRNVVSISNTDPRVIKFALYWMTHSLKVSEEKIQIRLHLYSDMDIEKETQFWIEKLGISIEQVRSPYIKKTTKNSLSYKSFGHGTCNLICFSSILGEKIAMSIKAVSDFYGEKTDNFWYN